jgi:hypothetical protein
MMKEAGASFSLYRREARADFLFQREKRIFCVFSSLLSLFGDRVEFFVSIKQQKRDFTSEI